ncbi:MAG: acetate--CoA ligase family protein [Candidatus Latescibacteria bacterium]|jgi:acyl-CoA synthetase (NDP forming)|nr:acetate--CoA ligase family protein [Candidatus Latescibacterota bacterium]
MGETELAIDAILDKRHQGQLQLSEEEGKRLLRLAGIDVPECHLARELEETKQAATELGYPVVVKGLVEGITHKTDHGLVQVGISSDAEMEACFLEMADRCSELGENWVLLIEQQKSFQLETVVGLTTDPSFGKVLMFGLGGIFVEVLEDVSFRLCPITRSDAEDMIASLQASRLFSGVRGRKPVDTDRIVDFLLSIGGESGIVGKHGNSIDVLEINPAVIGETGSITALDAVVTLSDPASPRSCDDAEPAVDMGPLFSPRSIGVVGVSPDRSSFAREFLESSLQMGYRGKVYPINLKHDGKEVLGWRIYDRIGSVPEDIDYLYVCVPAAAVPGLLEDGKDRVRFAHVITSGFGEASADGKKMEQTILTQARESGIRLIGPNCLGMYSPKAGLTLIEGAPKEAGSIGIISQSGGLTADIIRMGGAAGLRFSQAISIGNSIDLGIEDFLEYMGRDPATKVIGIYAEQARNGQRLSRLLSEICQVKPVVILRGGRSPLGAKAASSHTGALVSDTRLWESMCRQHGAILVKSFSELIYTLLAFQNLDPDADNTLFLFGQSGGTTVLAADDCDENGLAVPQLEEQLEQEILSMGIPPGTSVKNPVDAPVGTLAVDSGGLVKEIFSLVSERMQFSYELMHFNVQNTLSYTRVGLDIIGNLVDFAVERGGRGGPRNRKLALVLKGNREREVEDIAREQSARALEAGVPVFPDLGDALKALGRLVACGAWRQRQDRPAGD